MSDLDGLGLGSGGEVDPLYAQLMEQAKGLEEGDRAEQENHIPAGDYYFEVKDAKGKVNTWEGKTFVSAGFQIKVIEGKQGVGRVAFGDLDLLPSKQVWDDGKKAFRDATAKEAQDNAEKFIKTMKRVARVFGLGQELPSGTTEAAITSWIKPAIGKKGVMGIRVKVGKDGVARNRFWWANLAAPDDMQYKDKQKTKEKGTALEVLRKAVSKQGNGKAQGGASLD